jgi:RNA polymerase sigma-70 factor (ECF subfamily)
MARSRGETAGAEYESDTVLLRRFVVAQEEAAFAALVRRHGPLVWAACRRLLPYTEDAEDAFQATFLVLVRKARAIRQPELLGNWLYGVAYRTARKARAMATRRRAVERQVACMPPVNSSADLPDLTRRELRAVLDEALHGLPEKYRAPLVLCYLQGLTNEEAARRLGWPVGSMSTRLARGRELLHQRLKNRCPLLSAGLLATALPQHAGPTPLPGGLADATVRAAMSLFAGKTAVAAAVSPDIRALSDGVVTSMWPARLWSNATLLWLLAICSLGGILLAYGTASGNLTNYLWGNGAKAPPRINHYRPAGMCGCHHAE